MKVREVPSFEETAAVLQVSYTLSRLITHSAYAVRIGPTASYRLKQLEFRIRPNLRY